jgi:DtxR family Mn-dependent transcriptional regulator
VEKEGYFTLKGYRLREAGRITDAMEDYVEMLFREGQGGEVRTGRLAQLLHVRPSSVSKMAAVLREEGLAEYQPYEAIALTPRGRELGAYLLRRHQVLRRFFRCLNGPESSLEEVEQLEHFIRPRTLKNLELLLDRLEGGESSPPPPPPP